MSRYFVGRPSIRDGDAGFACHLHAVVHHDDARYFLEQVGYTAGLAGDVVLDIDHQSPGPLFEQWLAGHHFYGIQ